MKILKRNLQENLGEELAKGIAEEAEHKATYDFLLVHVREHGCLPPEKVLYTHIANDHLKKDPMYYTKLATIEKD